MVYESSAAVVERRVGVTEEVISHDTGRGGGSTCTLASIRDHTAGERERQLWIYCLLRVATVRRSHPLHPHIFTAALGE